MRTQERPRGVTLRRLDLTAEVSDITARERERSGSDREEGRADYAWAAIQVDGQLYAICTEGVGQEVTDDEPLSIDFFFSRINDEGKHSFDILPKWSGTYSPAEVEGLMTDEEVDLADFVRVFGSRLESNFWLWFNRLQGVNA